MTFIFPGEASFLLWLQNNLRGPVLDPIMTTITHLGDGGIFWIIMAALLMCIPKTRKTGLVCAVSMIIGLIATNLILKNLVGRVRPYELIEGLTILIKTPHDWSFPSGHTTNAFAAAWVMFTRLPKKYGVPALILAILIALSRMYVGVHYPTDVLGGVIVGCSAAWCAGWILRKFPPER